MMNFKDIEDFFYGRVTAEESARIEEWLLDNADTPEVHGHLKELLDGIDASRVNVNVDDAFRRMKKRINPAELHSIARKQPARRRPALRRVVQWVSVAAVLITLLGVSFYYRHQSNSPKEWVEQHTALGEKKRVVLPDNSVVWLNVGSKVIYPKKFNNHIRQIYVVGEVFADVKKDEKRPFVLSAGEVSVRVLGTKFNVRSYLEDSQVEVVLVEGAVNLEVALNNNISVYRLSPGDVVNFDKTTGQLGKYDLNPATYKNWAEEGGLYFRDLTLKDIACYLERYFMVRIVIADPELEDYTFYTSFVNNENVHQILATLNSSKTMNIYERNDIIYIEKLQ